MEIIRATDPQGRDADILTVALAQISPIHLDRTATTEKIVDAVEKAAGQGAQLVCFGEALLPGYPFWVEQTDGARFESDVQKAWFDRYLDQGVQIERGDLQPICDAAQKHGIAVYLGMMERAADRGGQTLYCSLAYINASGTIQSVHRKLQPTYEERLVWGAGDGHGLRTHKQGAFTVGGLNCWENWMPLARASLYGMGEDLHVAVWPGGGHNTEKLTPVMAIEGRSFALSVSGLMRASDIPNDLPGGAEIAQQGEAKFFANGGSCIAGPDGEWIIPPVTDKEALLVAQLDHAAVRRARLTFDAAGHYSRPDVLSVNVNRRRLSTIHVDDD